MVGLEIPKEVNGVTLSPAQQETFATARPPKPVDLANVFGWVVIEGFDFQCNMFLADCVLSASGQTERQNLGLFVGGPNDSHKYFSSCATEKRFVK